jgi:glutathione S-transferase
MLRALDKRTRLAARVLTVHYIFFVFGRIASTISLAGSPKCCNEGQCSMLRAQSASAIWHPISEFDVSGLSLQETSREALEKARAEFQLWENYLSDGRTYLIGEQFTLADVNLACVLLFAVRAGALFRTFPSLNKYTSRMSSRVSIRSTWPPHWKQSPNKDWLCDL